MKHFLNTLKISVLGLLLAAGISYGWTMPAGSPPTNNVSAPINVSTSPQNKLGALGLNVLSIFQQGQVSTDSTYVAPTAVLWGVNGTVGAKKYCDEEGLNCVTPAQLVAAVSGTNGTNAPVYGECVLKGSTAFQYVPYNRNGGNARTYYYGLTSIQITNGTTGACGINLYAGGKLFRNFSLPANTGETTFDASNYDSSAGNLAIHNCNDNWISCDGNVSGQVFAPAGWSCAGSCSYNVGGSSGSAPIDCTCAR